VRSTFALQAKFSARDDDGGAADLDLLGRLRDRVQRGRASDLRALRDLDLLAERDAAVPREVERERSGRRARRRVLVDRVRGNEDARAPAPSLAREAVHPFAQQRRERLQVRTQRSHRLG